MDYDVELRFQELTKELEKEFGPGLDTQAILFLIGVQELGQGYQQFTKQKSKNCIKSRL